MVIKARARAEARAEARADQIPVLTLTVVTSSDPTLSLTPSCQES